MSSTVREQLHVGIDVEVARELRALAKAAERPIAGEVRVALKAHIARQRRAEIPERQEIAR